MKILLFIDSLGAGGAQRQLAGLAVMLKQRGHSVKVCSYQDIDFYKPYLVEHKVENNVILDASNPKKRIRTVYKYFRNEKPDIVIAYLATPSIVSCLSKLFGCKFKLIVSERNTTQRVGINEHIRFFLYHFADAVVPNSYSQEKWLTEHYPWMKKCITTIPNFVDLRTFEFIIHKRHEVPVIMVAATIWTSKNTPGLIEAANILKNRGLRFKILWYGKADKWIDYYKGCQKKIKEYRLNDMVELLPKTPKIQEKYLESDYFCLPSFYEGTPNVICEAMSSGLPVICSDVCDNPRYVYEHENGFLFDPHNYVEIADKIEQALLLSDEDYVRFCKKSRALAEELLSEEVFINNYIKLINKIR